MHFYRETTEGRSSVNSQDQFPSNRNSIKPVEEKWLNSLTSDHFILSISTLWYCIYLNGSFHLLQHCCQTQAVCCNAGIFWTVWELHWFCNPTIIIFTKICVTHQWHLFSFISQNMSSFWRTVLRNIQFDFLFEPERWYKFPFLNSGLMSVSKISNCSDDFSCQG